MVIWFIGLSGTGKTTLSQLLYERLKPGLPNLVRLDGDVLRDTFGNDVDHTIAGRRRNAERMSALTKFLASQDIHVLAAVLSLFPDWQKWNRENISNYTEVYLKASMDTLVERDIKNLYAPALRGEIKDVVGVDIPFPDPPHADLIIDNDNYLENLTPLVDQVLSLPAVAEVASL